MTTTSTTTSTNGNSNNNSSNTGLAAKLARSNILELQPYRCARDDYSNGILLDANENSFGSPTTTTTTTTNGAGSSSNNDKNNGSCSITTTTNEQQQGSPTSDQQNAADDNHMIAMNRYPDPYQLPLKERWCEYRSGGGGTDPRIRPENIFVGVGSDEAIDILMRIFCIPGTTTTTTTTSSSSSDGNNSNNNCEKDAILTTPPTYGMYKVCAKVNDVSVITVPLTTEFDVQTIKVLETIKQKRIHDGINIKMVFLCSPGNPTAKTIPLDVIETIAKAGMMLPGTSTHDEQEEQQTATQPFLVVVDEAYIDFAPKEKSAVSLVRQYPNIVVLQTLSKAFGLAAIRCGFCIGPSDIIQLMNNVKAPYNVNALTEQMALQALQNVHIVHDNIDSIYRQRAILIDKLQQLEFVIHVYPSESNFILFRMKQYSKEVYKIMAEKYNVVTRYRGTELHCNECIRVTVGTQYENDTFIKALQDTYYSLLS